MNKFFKDAVLWGVILWLVGYILGFVFFMLVPQQMIGWFIMPVGILITLWVLAKKINGPDMLYYLKVAIAWTAIAIVFDWLFLVQLLKPSGGYYKLDVYFYYATTFVLPLIAGIFKTQKRLIGASESQIKIKEEGKQKILEGIDMQKSINNDSVQNLLGVSDATATRYLDELEKEGKIRQIGKIGKGVFYEKT